MTRPRSLLLAPALAALLLTSGCAYVRGSVSAESARGPVSLTPHVLDAQGELLTLGEELEEVGSFTTTTTFVSAFYGLLPPFWTWDASDYINEQLDRYGGEGVVNFTASAETATGLETLYAFYTQAQPFFPIWVELKVSGTVVRRKQP